MSTYLGVDIGSTRTKLVVWSESDGILARAAAPTPVIRGGRERPDDHDRRDHDAVWQLLTSLAEELPVSLRRDVRGVAVASVGEEIVLLAADGRSAAPTACWYVLTQNRAEKSAETAILSWQMFADLRADDPAALTSAASFTDLGSWVSMRIAGLAASDAVTDRSHASRTGLLTDDGEWDPRELAASGADLVGAPPRLVESGSRIGRISPAVAAAWGLPHDVAVHAGGHDHFCGALAAGVRESGDVFVSVGTSESIVQLVDRARLRSIEQPGEHGFFVQHGLGYVHRSQPSGRTVAALLEAHGDPDIGDLYAELSRPAGAPLSSAAATLDEELRRQAVRSAQLIDALSAVSGLPATRVVIGGVPVASAHWRDVRQQALDRTVEFVDEPELAGMGAAMLAATMTESDR